MGRVIHSHLAPQLDLTATLKPIIYCDEEAAMADRAVSINHIMSEKLFSIHPKRRTMRLAQCFEDVLKTLPDDVIIKEFDVMFNPEYKIDVLKIMVDARKRKSFRIIWPGTYEDGKLVYAEDGDQDYKVFIVKDYDITCII